MEDKKYICERLGINEAQMTSFFDLPNKTFRDYKNSSKLITAAIRIAVWFGAEKRNFRV
jgi:hypothetical protein